MKNQLVKFLPLFLLLACNSEAPKQQNTSEKQEQSIVPNTAAKPEMYLYMVTTNNLLLRDQPTQKATGVITKLQAGEIVEGAGELSKNKEEATLNGMYFLEPFHQVVSVTPEQYKGWAFGGGLLPLYAGPRANAPDLGSISRLTMFLAKLDYKQLATGKKIWDYLQAKHSADQGPLADAAFLIARHFMMELERKGEFYAMTENVEWSNEDYEAVSKGQYDMNKTSLTKQLATNGFSLACGEGMVFPVVNLEQFSRFFSSKLTPAMRTFLNGIMVDFKNSAFDDGGIVIPLEQLADRSAFWEKFNQENPHFVLSDQSKSSQEWTMATLICGADNTPCFDYETNVISEDFKKAWTYTLSKYPGTNLAKQVKTMVDLCAAEGWKNTAKVEAFRTKIANPEG